MHNHSKIAVGRVPSLLGECGEAANEGINEGAIPKDEGIFEGLNEGIKNRFRVILKAIEENSKLDIAQIASELHVNERTIKRDLKYLKENAFMRFVGPKKTGYYVLTEKRST